MLRKYRMRVAQDWIVPGQTECRSRIVHVVQKLSNVERQVAELRLELRSQVGEVRTELAEVRALLASRQRGSRVAFKALLDKLPVPEVDAEPLSDETLDLIFEARRTEE